MPAYTSQTSTNTKRKHIKHKTHKTHAEQQRDKKSETQPVTFHYFIFFLVRRVDASKMCGFPSIQFLEKLTRRCLDVPFFFGASTRRCFPFLWNYQPPTEILYATTEISCWTLKKFGEKRRQRAPAFLLLLCPRRSRTAHRLHVHLRLHCHRPCLAIHTVEQREDVGVSLLVHGGVVLLNHRDLVLVSSDSSMWPIGCFACDALPTPIP